LTANSIKRKAVLLHRRIDVQANFCALFFPLSSRETRVKQPEIRGRRPLCHGLTTPLLMVGHLSVADSQIVYYKQLRGSF